MANTSSMDAAGLSIDESQWVSGSGNPNWSPTAQRQAELAQLGYTKGTSTLQNPYPDETGFTPGLPKPTTSTSAPSSSSGLSSAQQKQYDQLIAAGASKEAAMNAAKLVPAGTQQSQSGQPTQPTQATQAKPAITPTGSVVDTLKLAGQDSSFAARQQLAAQYGIQGYTGTAAQNQLLEKKFVEAHNALKGGTAPQTGAEAKGALQSLQQASQQSVQGNPTQQFFDAYGSMSPIEASIYDTLSQLMSPANDRQLISEIYAQEMAKAGLGPLQEDLAQTIADIRMTEENIREEAMGGGMVLESQIRGIAAVRTKALLTKAEQLQNIINSKTDYVDNIVRLTQADRDQVDKEIDRKIGLTKTLFEMTTAMQDRARENYKMLIDSVGYDGLVNSISSQQELNKVASTLGMSPQTLLRLSTQQTSAQREQELQMMQYQLSVDKFNEDKRQFGMSYALEQQKLANQKVANSLVSPYSMEKATRTLDFISQIRPNVSSATVGFGSLISAIPGTPAADFKAKVASLESAIAFGELQEMRDASKTGGALGQVAIKELELLTNSLGSLSRAQSPEQFLKSLNTVEDNVYRWNAQKLSASLGFDYANASNSINPNTGKKYTSQEIYTYLVSQ